MQVHESSPLTVVHDGQTHRFCSEHCRQTFRARLAAGESVASILSDAARPMMPPSKPVVTLGLTLPHSEPSAPRTSPKDRIY